MNTLRGYLRASLIAPLSCVLALASGCMVGPNYRKPNLAPPPAFQEAHADANNATVPAPKKWWEVFQDPVLNELEDRAANNNQDIRSAVTRVDQADALRRSAGSFRYPTVGVQPQAGRTRYAKNRPNNQNSTPQASTFTDVVLPLTLGYEVDAWGRIRRQVQSAVANQQATADDLQFVRLMVAASVATDYFSVREADAEAKIVTDTTVDLQRGFEVTSSQFRKGIVSELPVKQAESILQQAHAQLEAIHLRRAQAEHAIAVVTGIPVEGFHIAIDPSLVTNPVIPPGLPADMLQRRPDVQGAERRAAAASEQIGIAKAAYYPQFTISGLAGVESTTGGGLLDWQNTIASLIGSAAAPIFTGGRLRANVDQATAVYRGTLADYEKTVVSAYGDVEDQLSAVHYLDAQGRDEEAVVESARRSEQIATNRYKAGLVSYLDVVFAQQTLLQNEQVLAQINGQRSATTVALIRALGGGW